MNVLDIYECIIYIYMSVLDIYECIRYI